MSRLAATRAPALSLRRSLATSSRLAFPPPSPSPSSSSSSSSAPSTSASEFEDEFTDGPPPFLRGFGINKDLGPAYPAGRPRKGDPRKDRGRKRPIISPDLVPVTLERPGAGERERIAYEVGKSGGTLEKMAYYAEDEGVQEMLGGTGMSGGTDWEGVGEGGEVKGLEAGRVVECRRSGQMTIGLILSSIVLNGRARLLVLRTSGEIWPVSNNDIQFIMPQSLIPPDLAQQCWTPDLLHNLGRGDEPLPADPAARDAMTAARRRGVMIMRKIVRETERMCGRMMGGVLGRGRVGGVEAVWEHFAPKDDPTRDGAITAHEAAGYILNMEGADRTIGVKPWTLPAYAAHVFMMQRSHLFLADQGTMWQSGTFLVRSRAERAAIDEVVRLADGATSQDRKALEGFVRRAQRALDVDRRAQAENAIDGQGVREVPHDLEEWTETDQRIMRTILSRMAERRSTQVSEVQSSIIKIVRAIGLSVTNTVEPDAFAMLLTGIGILPRWDSIKRFEAAQNEKRDIAMSRVVLPPAAQAGADQLLRGDELDAAREDFTSHTVFVIDDPTASELDDGISVEKVGEDDFWVHMHIADPTRLIAANHPLALRASFRGSSSYLPEGGVPLFEDRVIMEKLSLGAKVDGPRAVMTFSARMGKGGELRDMKTRMGWISKPRVVTYQAVNDLLNIDAGKTTRPLGMPAGHAPRTPAADNNNKGDISAADADSLRLLHSLALAHRAQRLATSGFEYEWPHASISILGPVPPSPLASSGRIPSRPALWAGSLPVDYTVTATPQSSFTSNLLVAELMILAGRIAASFCGERGIPVPFRGSSMPRPVGLPGLRVASIEELLSKRDRHTFKLDPFDFIAANVYGPAVPVQTRPHEHWVMGLKDGYLRATSPLRRYEDMLVHWQIKAYLAQERGLTPPTKAMTHEEIATLARRSDIAMRRIRRAGVTAGEYWQCGTIARYLKPGAQVGEGPDVVDLGQPLVARVAGLTAPSLSGLKEVTPMFIPALAAEARIVSPAGEFNGAAVGEERMVQITQAVQWPAPGLEVVLA